MKTVARIATLYAVIAGIATAANLSCQALVNWAYQGPHAVPLSVLVGTACGTPIKYVLEKKWIFSFRADSLVHDGRMFAIYIFFGIFTTALFWGIEYGFHVAFGTPAMRYLGGAIGLTLGAWIKYHLDKHFVFVAWGTEAKAP